MPLFSKPPARKPAPHAASTDGASGRAPVRAREVAAQANRSRGSARLEPVAGDLTVTGASITQWTPSQPAIEVAQANPGLCAVLENAALLYASGQAAQARALLEDGVANDHDTKLSPLAWLALFDLLERAGDRAAFDQYSLQYVVQFERSAPAWDERGNAKTPNAARRAGGYLAISGRLTPASSAQIEGLRKAIAKKVAHARLDLTSVTSFDDDGARLLALALADARRKGLSLAIEHPEKLRAGLEASVKKGREGGEGAWLLSLELMQWAHEQGAFEDRAIDYAMAFEMSPPSWEPPAAPAASEEPGEAAATAAQSSHDAIAWSGVLLGSATPHIAQLTQFAGTRTVVPIDLSAVDRVDFVCAGALLNAIDRIEGQRRAVQILGASPIIRALLLLIGVSPRHFVRKAS